MANRLYRRLSAVALLLFYVTIAVYSPLSVLLCDCHNHHASKAVVAEHHHCCQCHACPMSNWNNDSAISKKCGCYHDHSNNIQLYTLSRSGDEENMLQILPLPILVAESEVATVASAIVEEFEYSLYLLPPLSSVDKGCAALRAPPALV